MRKIFLFASLKLLKKGVGSGKKKKFNMEDGPECSVGNPDPLARGTDPDTHQNVTVPQHCLNSHRLFYNGKSFLPYIFPRSHRTRGPV
jgi:hypothetical protein